MEVVYCSQYFFHSQIQICLKNQMISWDKKTSYIILYKYFKRQFQENTVKSNFSSLDKVTVSVRTKVEMHVTNKYCKGQSQHFPDVNSNLVTDSSEIPALPPSLFSLCFPSVAQEYANIPCLSVFVELWTLAHSSGISLVGNCFLAFCLICIIVEEFSRDLVKTTTS